MTLLVGALGIAASGLPGGSVAHRPADVARIGDPRCEAEFPSRACRGQPVVVSAHFDSMEETRWTEACGSCPGRPVGSAAVDRLKEAVTVGGLDALHYTIAAEVGPAATEYRGWTEILLRVLDEEIEDAVLDFGPLEVDSVRVGGASAAFRQAGETLTVELGARSAGDTTTVKVYYHGPPTDGLVFGRNEYGQHTVFADNWPDRAHHWFPCIDRPGDKATVEFRVEAPAGWRVVANGHRVTAGAVDFGGPSAPAVGGAISASGGGTQVAIWTTDRPIPVYTMVIGASELAVAEVGSPLCDLAASGCVPVTQWMFPGDRVAATRLFQRAPRMVSLFDSLIGPFPYEKLALVQSTTRYGGMENASAIFFAESVVRRGGSDVIVAHEIAHQWFGDSVTEAEWPHLWLSEGFATYFASLFYELEVGADSAAALLREAELSYLSSGADVRSPIVGERPANLMRLLNRNNYQKGAWVLHMLRRLLGDEAFFTGIREYYRAHAHGTALTSDLRGAMEAASGLDLGWFFDQWLRRPGYPELRVRQAWADERRALILEVEQLQAGEAFRVPLEVEVEYTTHWARETFWVTGRRERMEWPLPGRPVRVRADPRNSLLGPVETLADSSHGADR